MKRKIIWMIALNIILILANPAASPALAQDGTPPPVIAEGQTAVSLPWFVPVILVIALVVGVTLLNQRIAAATKKPFNPSSCVPLMDDEPGEKKK